MNISKRKQGILAIICTIAMIVTSITVYNPREVKADPSTIEDSKWTLALNSETVSYYIADGKADKVPVKPQLEGDNYYIAFS